MQRIYKSGIFTVLMLFLAGLTSVGALGQGRGHDHGGGQPQGRGGGQQRQASNPGPQRQMQQRPAPQQMQRQQPRMERQQPRMERQQRQQIARPQQQPRSMPNVQRQLPRPQMQMPQNRGWQDRGSRMPDRARMPQQQRPQPQMRIERRPNVRMPQQQERQQRVDRRMDLGRAQQQNQIMRGDRNNGAFGRFNPRERQGNNNILGRDSGRSRGRQMQSRASGQFPAYNATARNVPARAFKFERQQIRQQENFLRQRSRDEGRRFDERSFRRAYHQHREYRENVLRSVIANFFVGDGNNYSYAQPQYYDNYYYGTPYNPEYYAYDTGYYQPQYDYSYAPDYSNDYTSGYAYPEEFPIGYFTEPEFGNVYTASMYRDLLAYGYEQGYEDGLYARQNRVSYDDPFAFEDTVYDPYSYSLGENRRCLGEGYQLGYQDAVAGDDEYAPGSDGNGVDLVSVLIGNALQLG